MIIQMNDEIKYWLEGLDDLSYKKVLDYITNLQQENERLKQTQYVWSYDLDMQLEDYKSRCEKAIKYLKECYSQPENIENFMTESEMNYLLNILQNGSDESVKN